MSSPQTFVGQRGEYEIQGLSPIAYGRMSVFFRVVDKTHPGETSLCAKLFKRGPEGTASSLDSFEKELRALQVLSHPNILPLVDFGIKGPDGGGPFLILPFCNDGNFRRLLEGKGFLPVTTAIPILQQVAEALDYAHGRGVIHADVKPENILLGDGGFRAYLADFGVAKYFAFEEDLSTVQPGENEGGTVRYLSPEQLADKSYSARSDIYSFAMVAYEALCGGLPFEREKSLYRQIHAKVTGDLIYPRDRNPALPEAAATALAAGLSVDPKKRPVSASELCRQIMGASAEPHATTISSQVKPPRKAMTKTRVAIITAVIAAIGTVLVALIQSLPQILEKARGK